MRHAAGERSWAREIRAIRSRAIRRVGKRRARTPGE
jgi:hypothetical protein